jgi:circadian clock protein KaiB
MKPQEKKNVTFKFTLYVAGDTVNSWQAVSNLTSLCKIHLPDHYEIELVDVLRNPKRALKDHILMTPTLIKFSPSPVGRVIGTLNQALPVLQALGIGPSSSEIE